MNHHNDNYDDVEGRLRRLTARGAGTEIREQVLAAVERELSAGPLSRWERRLGLAVAATILLGIGLNVWAVRRDRQSQARLYGPPPVPSHIAEIAEAVESVTDAETGERVGQQLSAVWRLRPTPPPQNICSTQLILNDLESPGKEQRHEHPEMDRDRPRGGDRGTSDRQRRLGPDHRFTA